MYRTMKLEGRATEASYEGLINHSGHSALQVTGEIDGDLGILGSELIQTAQQAMTILRWVRSAREKREVYKTANHAFFCGSMSEPWSIDLCR